jgi:L-amino acid N-acyltransferase YncA
MLSPRAILRTGARICSLRRKLLFESPLEEGRASSANAAVSFRYGDERDLASLTAPEHAYSGDARAFGFERLRAGDRLVLGESDGRVVFYAWVMFGQMDLSVRNYSTLPADCAYTYKLFTVADCRGRRICPAYYQWVKQELWALGYNRLLAWVEAGNHASIRSHTRAGFRRTACIWHFRFLFRSYFLVKPGLIPTASLERRNACVS